MPTPSGSALSGFDSLVRAFEQSLPHRLAQLQAAIAASDWKEADHVSHILKGSAGSFGYERITTYARALELALKARNAQSSAHAMEQLLLLEEVQAVYRQENPGDIP